MGKCLDCGYPLLPPGYDLCSECEEWKRAKVNFESNLDTVRSQLLDLGKTDIHKTWLDYNDLVRFLFGSYEIFKEYVANLR